MEVSGNCRAGGFVGEIPWRSDNAPTRLRAMAKSPTTEETSCNQQANREARR
jgi:hypothetical protein